MAKVVVQILRAPIGGIRKHVYDIIEYLGDKDIEQIFITNTQDADQELPRFHNLKVIHLNIADQPKLQDLKNIFAIYSHLKKANVDIIHGHGAKGGLYARILALFINVKCIYTPHGGSLHRVYGPIKNRIYSFIEFCLIPLTNVFLFESKYSCQEFSKNIYNIDPKSIINYNGVETPQNISHKIYEAGNKLNLASFGLLRNLKGHDIAIIACSLLKAQKIPFEFTIYGSGEEKENLLKLISKYKLENNIFIREYSCSVIEEMKKYDFILHPSRFESFGYVPVEAMSMKIPVIVSSAGGLKEVVTSESGYISHYNSPEEYRDILVRIYNGDEALNQKIENAYQRVLEMFSKGKMLQNIEEIYFN